MIFYFFNRVFQKSTFSSFEKQILAIPKGASFSITISKISKKLNTNLQAYRHVMEYQEKTLFLPRNWYY